MYYFIYYYLVVTLDITAYIYSTFIILVIDFVLFNFRVSSFLTKFFIVLSNLFNILIKNYFKFYAQYSNFWISSRSIHILKSVS